MVKNKAEQHLSRPFDIRMSSVVITMTTDYNVQQAVYMKNHNGLHGNEFC